MITTIWIAGWRCQAFLPEKFLQAFPFDAGEKMIFGFDTNVPGKSAVYHVQTEDRGVENPVIESIIYIGDRIVDQVRTPYIPQVIGPRTLFGCFFGYFFQFI